MARSNSSQQEKKDNKKDLEKDLQIDFDNGLLSKFNFETKMIMLVVLTLFLTYTFYLSGKIGVLSLVKSTLSGVFGFGVFFIPILVGYYTYYVYKTKQFKIDLIKTIFFLGASLTFTMLVSSVVNNAEIGATTVFYNGYETGSVFCVGFIATLVSNFLCKIIGQGLSIIFFVIATVLLIFFGLNKDLQDIRDIIKSQFNKMLKTDEDENYKDFYNTKRVKIGDIEKKYKEQEIKEQEAKQQEEIAMLEEKRLEEEKLAKEQEKLKQEKLEKEKLEREKQEQLKQNKVDVKNNIENGVSEKENNDVESEVMNEEYIKYMKEKNAKKRKVINEALDGKFAHSDTRSKYATKNQKLKGRQLKPPKQAKFFKIEPKEELEEIDEHKNKIVFNRDIFDARNGTARLYEVVNEKKEPVKYEFIYEDTKKINENIYKDIYKDVYKEKDGSFLEDYLNAESAIKWVKGENVSEEYAQKSINAQDYGQEIANVQYFEESLNNETQYQNKPSNLNININVTSQQPVSPEEEQERIDKYNARVALLDEVYNKVKHEIIDYYNDNTRDNFDFTRKPKVAKEQPINNTYNNVLENANNSVEEVVLKTNDVNGVNNANGVILENHTNFRDTTQNSTPNNVPMPNISISTSTNTNSSNDFDDAVKNAVQTISSELKIPTNINITMASSDAIIPVTHEVNSNSDYLGTSRMNTQNSTDDFDDISKEITEELKREIKTAVKDRIMSEIVGGIVSDMSQEGKEEFLINASKEEAERERQEAERQARQNYAKNYTQQSNVNTGSADNQSQNNTNQRTVNTEQMNTKPNTFERFENAKTINRSNLGSIQSDDNVVNQNNVNGIKNVSQKTVDVGQVLDYNKHIDVENINGDDAQYEQGRLSDYSNNANNLDNSKDTHTQNTQNTQKIQNNQNNQYIENDTYIKEDYNDSFKEEYKEDYNEYEDYELEDIYDDDVALDEIEAEYMALSNATTSSITPSPNNQQKPSGLTHIDTVASRNKPYEYPSIDILAKNTSPSVKMSDEEIKSNSELLEQTLSSFGVKVKVLNVTQGPTVTRYELQPGIGVKVSKIVSLSDDLALNLAAQGLRIEAPIPGKSAVGIEVPNAQRENIFFRDILENDEFLNHKSKIAVTLGKDISGKPVVADIATMPHLLVAGATGSGKSVCINTLITSILYRATPEECKLLMIDPKVVELSIYNGIPHLMIPVVTDPKKACSALQWAVSEMEKRYEYFAEASVRNLEGYNAYVEENNLGEKLPQVVIIVDELADLMMTAGKEVEESICRLTQKARAAGIHLIVATQRPSVDVITGLIKANIPSRIAFSVSSAIDSRTILGEAGAEKLLGRGDMLFIPYGTNEATRIQGAFISDKEVENIVKHLKETSVVTYDESIIDEITSGGSSKGGISAEDSDELLGEALEFFIERDKASVSMLQTRFKVGYNRAARIVDTLESAGYLGAPDGSKGRKILITREEFEELGL